MHQPLIAAKERKAAMDLKISIEHLIRLAFEQPALLSGVFMTPLLEGHAGGPLQVRLLAQQLCLAQAPLPELMLDRGEPILERKVLLQGRENAITYLYAESVIVPRALPEPASARLLHGPTTDSPMSANWSARTSATSASSSTIMTRRATAARAGGLNAMMSLFDGS